MCAQRVSAHVYVRTSSTICINFIPKNWLRKLKYDTSK
jgi:hypothetical protein